MQITNGNLRSFGYKGNMTFVGVKITLPVYNQNR